MPEIVYPSPDADGKPRTWNDVFPIWQNDDEDTEWRIIDQILEAVAINNRFGGKTPAALRAHIIKSQTEWFAEELAKNTGSPHDHKTEFPGKNWAEILELLPEDRKQDLEERAILFKSLGKWLFYIDQVFANLGGAYREYKG